MASQSDAKSVARDMLTRYGTLTTSHRPHVTQRRGLEGHSLIEHAQEIRHALATLTARGLPSPYFIPRHGFNGATIDILGNTMINFAGFNYLGLGSHPHVVAAAKGAIDQYGTSASASRVVAGELPLYRHLEDRLAAAYGVDDAVICPSGFLTNAAVIAFLLTPADLAVCDELVHSSIVSGTQWAQCRRVMFRHNDPESLEVMLRRMRGSAERALVILEGVYSMDGDIAALPEMVAVAREYDSLIMIDEAHSLGTIGDAGMGVREHYGLPGDAVDVWMGTLSKALAGCGGYVSGSADLMWAIRMLAPGVSLYTTGPTPAQIAASTAALDVLRAEPQRVRRLQDNAAYLLAALRDSGWNTGASAGTPIVPLIIGEQIATVELSVWLLQNRINAVPITQHGVNAGQDRVRLFVSSEHNASQIDELVRLLHQYRSTTS